MTTKRKHNTSNKEGDTNVGTPKQDDWFKPAAMAIPEGGYFKDKVRKQGMIWSDLSQDANVLWLLDHRETIPGREPAVYQHASRIESGGRAASTAWRCSNCTHRRRQLQKN